MKVYLKGRFVGPFPSNKFEFQVEAADGGGQGKFVKDEGVLPITTATAGTFLRYFQADQQPNGKMSENLREVAQEYIEYGALLDTIAMVTGSTKRVFADGVVADKAIEFVWTEGPILTALRANACPFHELTDEDVDRYLNPPVYEEAPSVYPDVVGNDPNSKSPFKMGDKVKLTKQELERGSFTVETEVGTVVGRDLHTQVEFPNGHRWFYDHKSLELAQPKSEFKIGDKVKVKAGKLPVYSFMDESGVGDVVDVEKSGVVVIKWPKAFGRGYYTPEYAPKLFEIVTEPEFKVGDRVKIVSVFATSAWAGKGLEGRIGRILDEPKPVSGGVRTAIALEGGPIKNDKGDNVYDPYLLGCKLELVTSPQEPRYRIVDAGQSYTSLFGNWTAQQVGIPQEAVNLYKASQREFEAMLWRSVLYKGINGLVGTKVCAFKHVDDPEIVLIMLTLDNGLTVIVGDDGLERLV